MAAIRRALRRSSSASSGDVETPRRASTDLSRDASGKHTRTSHDVDRHSISSRRGSLANTSPRSPAKSSFVEGGNEGHRLPVEKGVRGRAEETGPASSVRGRASGGASISSCSAYDDRHVCTDFAEQHSLGHDRSHALANAFDPKQATHSHLHLAEKVKETRLHHEVEEVERIKHHERHVTHVQHHVQPIRDEEHLPEIIQQREIPRTQIEERHISTDDDHKAFLSLHTHRDTVKHAPKERKVVDLGERVNETVIHHVHNVVQPIIVKDTHEYSRIRTTIPVHHKTYEAPIVHQSIEHPIMDLKDFMSQRGNLGSKHTHDDVINNVLFTGECSRKVDGVAEDLARELNLKMGTMSHQHKADTRI